METTFGNHFWKPYKTRCFLTIFYRLTGKNSVLLIHSKVFTRNPKTQNLSIKK